MNTQGAQVTMKKMRVIRNRPVGRLGRMMVWKASSATPQQKNKPAINATMRKGRSLVEVSGLR